MSKKYKLSTETATQNGGGNFEVMYPMNPGASGLLSQNYDVNARIGIAGLATAGMPGVTLGPGFINPMSSPVGVFNNIGNTNMTGYIGANGNMMGVMSNGAYIKSDTKDGLKVGIPLTGSDSNVKVIIPPKINPKEPSLFMAAPASSTAPKTVTDKSNINMTFKEPMPKQTIVKYGPANLPSLPPSHNFNLPIAIGPTEQIVINPKESKARLEITSPDSDEIITISGEQENIKPVYEGIQKENKVKMAQNAVIIAGAEWDKVKAGIDFDTYKNMNDADINSKTELNDSQKKAIISLIRAKRDLRAAKKNANLGDDDGDISTSGLIDLTQLFNMDKVKEMLRSKFSLNDDKFGVEKEKKNQMSMFMNMPFPGSAAYGPVVSFN
jgi:hypothetical protein